MVGAIAGGSWLDGRPTSKGRQEARLILATTVATTIVYATGWGAAIAIAYALVAVQMLAQIPAVDWRSVLGWCVAGTVVGEVLAQVGAAPHALSAGRSHLMALVGLGLLSSVLWVVAATFAARDAIEQEVSDRGLRLAREASIDSLTQLLNRGAFTTALDESCAAGQPTILAFVDLDSFKDINDTFGHHVGDGVLVE